ncbi:DUF421 domain-containing protein [Virgibacillus xinjiangensis]|uniref:DUF421 domain-containing protein n=1 Tax=Virgibacillus xinjiangensis TaxID=393090 RepID=A0ABV7CTV2_9BACI
MPEIILILIRSIWSFLVLLLMARLMGKKQIAQLTFFDYVVGITIGSIAATMSVDQNVKISNGIGALVIWGLFPIILAYFGMKNRTFSQLTDGKPTVVIEQGKVLDKNMRKNRMTIDELMLQLREKGIFKISDIEMAMLETNGEISIMKKTEKQPITPSTLGIPVESEHGPTIVIMDGRVLNKSLLKLGYSTSWLLGEIQKQGAQELKDVFIAQIDSKGQMYVDLYKDMEKKQTVNERSLLAASLKKIQADLESYALQTENHQAKAMYANQAEKLQRVLDEVEGYMKGG